MAIVLATGDTIAAEERGDLMARANPAAVADGDLWGTPGTVGISGMPQIVAPHSVR